jgi:hypothetical protein
LKRSKQSLTLAALTGAQDSQLYFQVVRWAIARVVYGIETSPCGLIKPNETTGARGARRRVLSESDIRALWKATAGLGYPAGPFVRPLLLTGKKLGEQQLKETRS